MFPAGSLFFFSKHVDKVAGDNVKMDARAVVFRLCSEDKIRLRAGGVLLSAMRKLLV